MKILKNNFKSKEFKYFKKILKYFLKHKKEFAIILLLWIFNLFISVIEPFITAKEYSSIVTVDIKNIIKYTIIIFCIHISSSIISSVSALISEKFSKKVEIDIQKDITKEIFKLETKNFDTKGTDFFIERAIYDSRGLIGNIGNLRNDISNIISSFGVFLILFLRSEYLYI